MDADADLPEVPRLLPVETFADLRPRISAPDAIKRKAAAGGAQ